MSKLKFNGKLQVLIEKAIDGNTGDIDYIMSSLSTESLFSTTRFVDFALSLVEKESGKDRIKYYLFYGTQIQRNYASLYFNRLGDWEIVKEAFDNGLIDEIQAYAR